MFKEMGKTAVRSHLLAAVNTFVRSASKLSDVTRIALVGSLATPKANPKDADVLVYVADDIDLSKLARLGRQLKGTAQQINCGADIFLANEDCEYIGRTCHWRECHPGVRLSCHARNCGLRQFLYDDLDTLCLDSKLIAEPPLDLWPKVIKRTPLPQDVREILLSSTHSN